MRLQFRRLLHALPLVLGACAAPTGAADPAVAVAADDPAIVFHARAVLPGRAVPSVAVGDRGILEAVGALRTPCEPYDASAQMERVGTVVTITVVGRATGACPLDVVSVLPYRATVTGLAAGHYLVRLVHRYADANWPHETVLEQHVRVP
jgi:hypothetical protein